MTANRWASLREKGLGRALPTTFLLLSLALPAAAVASPSGPACEGELPFVLNAAVAPSGRFGVAEVGALAQELFAGVYRAKSPCADMRALQVNLAIGSEYHVLQWLEDGSVDMAIVSDLSLHLLREAEVDLVEVDLETIDFGSLKLPAALPERVLPRWRPTVRVESVEPQGGGQLAASASSPAPLQDLEDWLLSDLTDDPAGLAAVLREGEERCSQPDPADDPRVRLTLPSHLSTTGFVTPVARIQRRLATRLAELDGWGGFEAKRLREAAEGCFWRRLFDHTCFRLEEYRIESVVAPGPEGTDSCGARWRAEAEATGSLVELRLGREVAAGDSSSGLRDHLVLRRSEAEALAEVGAFPEARADLPEDFEDLLKRASRPSAASDPGAPLSFFRAIAVPDPFLGTRTFAFTPRESVELIGLHQRFSGRPRLSLVLPGGGVKAAFQSRLLEGLYGDGLLRNVGVEGPGSGEAVRVDSVVGTSGGALLGFFVARLGASGPWGLSDILWKRRGTRNADELVYLNAFDIFGSTDLPRYLSLIAIYLVFAGTLACFSVRHRGWLAPERNGDGARKLLPSRRTALLVLVVGLLGLTPLLVRWANGPASVEHVPELEGLLYAILVCLAIFADQALVHTERVEDPPRPDQRVWAPPAFLMAAGAALMAAPLLVKLVSVRAGGWLESSITSGEAYLLFAAVTGALLLTAVSRGTGRRRVLLELTGFLALFGAASLGAYALLHWVPPQFLVLLDRIPLLFLALFLALLVTAGIRYLGWASWIRGHRRICIVAIVVVACVVIFDLTRPLAAEFQGASLLEAFLAEPKLDAPRGGLFVCLGAVLAAIGGVLGLHHRRNRYQLQQPEKFVDGVVFLVLGLALWVYIVLGATVFLLTWFAKRKWFEGSPLFERAAKVSLFELTPDFWLALVVVSLLGSLGLLAWGRLGRKYKGRFSSWIRPFSGCIRDSAGYLCSRHPNGHVLNRRFVRIAVVAVGALLWWNLILAPALYGNRIAREYFDRVDGRFVEAHCRDGSKLDGPCQDAGRRQAAYGLTARFLAPANALQRDGTRFVLMIPGDQSCPTMPSLPGVIWRPFHVLRSEEEHSDGDACRDLLLADEGQRRDLMDYIFASGSPFPALPPRRVFADRELQTQEALVDGGYSNNVPTQAAFELGAVQALIIHSSNPVPLPAEPGVLASLGGPLVRNLSRLFGFLYERSQQLDRRSHSRMFVVSLAPPSQPDWPPLTDFRRATVERMIEEAEEGLRHRIGLVESWGPPRFQLSVTVLPDSSARRP